MSRNLGYGFEPDIKHFTLDEIKTNPDCQDADFISAGVDISTYTLKPERFNVSS